MSLLTEISQLESDLMFGKPLHPLEFRRRIQVMFAMTRQELNYPNLTVSDKETIDKLRENYPRKKESSTPFVVTYPAHFKPHKCIESYADIIEQIKLNQSKPYEFNK